MALKPNLLEVDESALLVGIPMSPLLTPQTLAQLSPLLNQFSASNSTILPVLLHTSQLLHLPDLDSPAEANSPKLSPETLAALGHHLISLASSRTPSIKNGESTESSLNPPSSDPTNTSSNWTSSALSYLDPRNVPISSLSSSFLSTFNSTTSSPELRKEFSQFRKLESQHRKRESSASNSTAEGSETGLRSKKEVKKKEGKEEGEASAGGSWGLRSVSRSWTKLIAGTSTPNSPKATTPRSNTPSVLPVAESGGAGGSTYPPQQPPPTQTTSIETEPSPPAIDLPNTDPEQALEPDSGPVTPAVELAPEVDEEELKDAMKGIDSAGGGEIETVEDVEDRPAETVKREDDAEELGKEDQEAKRALRFFGKDDEPFEVRLVEVSRFHSL